MFRTTLEKLAKSFVIQKGKELLRKIIKEITKTPEEPIPGEEPVLEKTHPWRACSIGRHWVKTHPLTVPASQKNPQPYKTPRDGHCADNPKRKNGKAILDYLDPDEINLIAEKHFSSLKVLPTPGRLLEFSTADKYDHIIGGWTQFWNEIFKPKEPLDPNFIKALITSESSFNLKPKVQNAGKSGEAHGFIQLTDEAIVALNNTTRDGEIKNHYIKLSKDEASDANISVCAGIRWLFNKKRLASNRLKREATWEEAVIEYKGYVKQMKRSKKIPQGILNLRSNYERLRK